MAKYAKEIEFRLNIPATDVLTEGCQKLLEQLSIHFPELGKKIIQQQNSTEDMILSSEGSK